MSQDLLKDHTIFYLQHFLETLPQLVCDRIRCGHIVRSAVEVAIHLDYLQFRHLDEQLETAVRELVFSRELVFMNKTIHHAAFKVLIDNISLHLGDDFAAIVATQ